MPRASHRIANEEQLTKVNRAFSRYGYSRKELAEKVGVSLQTIHRFFQHKDIDFINFSEICHLLGLDWREIAGLNDPQTPHTPYQDSDNETDNTASPGDIDFSDPTIGFPEGSLPPNSPFYIKRPPTEEKCYQAIRQPSSLIRIRAPKLMGKTSLMNRILDRAAKQGARTVQLDFNIADSTTLADKGKLLRWFWSSIIRELKLEKQVANWDDGSNPNLMCTNYFEDYLLQKVETALVLGLDQVDRLFPYEPTAKDFFALIRAWHGKNSDNLWRRLRLIITYATDVYIPLNSNQSPFNVGVPIKLPDFSEEQILELAKKYNLNWNEEQASKLYGMVGGHPHLIRIAIYNSSQKSFSLSEILQYAPTQESIYIEHLNDCWRTLKKDRTLCDAFRNVVASPEPIRLNPEETRILERIGLVKKKGDTVYPRYKLHREFFQKFL